MERKDILELRKRSEKQSNKEQSIQKYFRSENQIVFAGRNNNFVFVLSPVSKLLNQFKMEKLLKTTTLKFQFKV